MTAWIRGYFEAEPSSFADWSHPTDICAYAVRNAVTHAGLTAADVDAILTYDSVLSPHLEQAAQIAERIGAIPHFASTVSSAGATPITAIAYATAMIETGMIRNAVIAHADLRRSRPPQGGMIAWMAAMAGDREFEVPYGPITATYYAMLTERFLHDRGLGEHHLDEISRTQREYAQLNPNAQATIPLDEDTRANRRVAGSFRNRDCCLVTDFASAVVVSSEPGDGPPVAVAGVGGCVVNESFHSTNWADHLLAPRRAGERAYAMAGCTPNDIDFAELYDSFTGTVLMQLEAYGLDRGMGLKAFFDTVGLGQEGFPVNTHGGMLAASTSGLLHVVEAARQLRYEAGERQVAKPRRALVSNAGGVFSLHSAAILERR